MPWMICPTVPNPKCPTTTKDHLNQVGPYCMSPTSSNSQMGPSCGNPTTAQAQSAQLKTGWPT